MKYRFKAIADYEEIINEKLKKLCSRFSKFCETVVNINTVPSTSGMIWYDIEVLTPVVKFNGYSHVATLRIETIKDEGKTENVNVIFPSNDFQDENFSKYFDISFRCDHCHTNRYRTKVHIFRHDQSNEDLMIASSCAKSYFGENVFKLLGLYEMLSPSIIEGDLEDIFESCGGRGRSRFNTSAYCAYAYGIMKKYNTFISQRKKAELMGYGSFVESTKDKTELIFNDESGFPEDFKRKIREERKECIELAKVFDIAAVKEYWFKKYEEDLENNFVRSCFLNLSMITPKTGFLIYAVSVYMREVEGCFNSNIGSKKSKFVGTIGERMRDMPVTVNFFSFRETEYGLCTTIKFLDTQGNILVWFASGRIDLEMNKLISLTGTVKKHDEYRGKKQTILSRCKIK